MAWSATARLALLGVVIAVHGASGFGDFKFPAWGAPKAPEVPKRVVPPETETRPIVIYSPAFTRHRPRSGDLPTPYHPERPARVINAEKQLREKYGASWAIGTQPPPPHTPPYAHTHSTRLPDPNPPKARGWRGESPASCTTTRLRSTF